MTGELSGQTAIVTGASSGFGRKIARYYADEGATVVCADIRETPREGGYEDDPDRSTPEIIEREGGEAIYVECDVTDPDTVSALVETCVSEFGGLDVFVNNAGIYPPLGKVHERPVEDLDRAYAVNVKGVWNGSKYAVQQFLEQDSGGTIINVVSLAGLCGWAEQAAYNASKGAAKQLTETLAIEYGPEGVRVNAICPGFAPTALTSDLYDVEEFKQKITDNAPYGDRWVSPEDVANAAVFLASEKAAFITGECLTVDGGYGLTYAHTRDL
ncbi:glucose 1-dehydrogenase [Halorubrum sp. CBA1125]|jgi:NAD(P)-dependent dehydrogenase (short-subunit alcohol dehydrogenase family)|uniref:SDR family NAD(P)-dependent oxidoreductase n=1 Tax=Halorubrum sp. CBA1125 TaxID=2668072 RepID=UPI0012E94816|nr:SDR family oxidoreductase [Halorubrum sp. CBA1125]MUW14901.1 glucose 1-dehydrogenase [Halorubrum sp. CBA1125]